MTRIITSVLSNGLSGTVFQLPFLDFHENFQLHSVVERSTKKAKKVYPNVISFDTVEEAFDDKDVELIVVNTPNFTHYDFAKKALESGKHVLVEKPLAPSLDEAKELYKIAEENNLKLLVYQNRRFDGEHISIKDVLASGKLGNIVEAHFRFDRYRFEIGPKIGKETALPGAGILFDLGPHLIDCTFDLFGLPDSWSVNKSNNRPNTLVDDYANIHLSYNNGPNVFLTASMLVLYSDYEFVLHGTKGSYMKKRSNIQEEQLMSGMNPSDENYGIENPEENGLLSYINGEGNTIKEMVLAPQSSYLKLFDSVYENIRKGVEYFVSKKEILKQIEILENKKRLFK